VLGSPGFRRLLVGQSVSCLGDSPFDGKCLITDLRMPGMDGFEVCRRIKSNPKTAHVPVVMDREALAVPFLAQLAAAGQPVIKITGLGKSYGSFEAVRGIDLTVRRGEIYLVAFDPAG